jgi:geranylgeranyl diphosphate synthase type I
VNPEPDRGPLDVADLRARVEKALAAFLDRQRAVLAPAGDAAMGPVHDYVVDLLSSGKRLRPAFCYWGWRGAGGPDGDGIVEAATSLELLHAGAIVHDDVMDGSDSRRGLPSAHRRFAALHREHAWSGDPAAFGAGAAILLGDLCLCWSDELFNTAGLPAEALTRGRAVFDVMRTEVMAGQYLDLREQARADGTVESARTVIRFKTAKYTVERPLHLGAALAGADAQVRAAYSGYGLPLGEAFQLRDDVLGVFGDPEVTGKPAGDDLREGKRTVLVAATLERATPVQAAAVRRHLGDPDLDASALDALRTIITETGALAAVEARIAEQVAHSLEALESAALARDAVQVLHDLAVASTVRSG